MDLFVYGTLQSQPLMEAVSGAGVQVKMPATLPGYGVYPVKDDVVPFIARSAEAEAAGILYQNLTEGQVARLNLYEGAFGYQHTDVVVQTADGPRNAVCYLPPSDVFATEGTWLLADWEAEHLAPAILAAKELYSHNPLPSFVQLRRMWPMIEARAWSKHRATGAPATRRFSPGADDFKVLKKHPPQGQFFRLQSVEVAHAGFDGREVGPMVREGFFGIDATIVLPYDARRDRVLLVEQARVGPGLRHDPNPWMLEPVAGIIDARETPEAAALRECKEEAGLQIAALESAGSFYVSPGATTDYFYTYVGICDLPNLDSYRGGLADEAEDLRLHPLAFDDAMALADSGEIATGPALFLLHWVLRHKDRLQARHGALPA